MSPDRRQRNTSVTGGIGGRTAPLSSRRTSPPMACARSSAIVVAIRAPDRRAYARRNQLNASTSRPPATAAAPRGRPDGEAEDHQADSDDGHHHGVRSLPDGGSHGRPEPAVEPRASGGGSEDAVHQRLVLRRSHPLLPEEREQDRAIRTQLRRQPSVLPHGTEPREAGRRRRWFGVARPEHLDRCCDLGATVDVTARGRVAWRHRSADVRCSSCCVTRDVLRASATSRRPRDPHSAPWHRIAAVRVPSLVCGIARRSSSGSSGGGSASTHIAWWSGRRRSASSLRETIARSCRP